MARIFITTCLAIVYLTCTSTGIAQTRDWLEEGDGAYETASFWSGANVPDTAAESARFSLNLTYDVNVNGDYTVGSLLGHGGNVTLAFRRPSVTETSLTYTATNLLMEPALGGTAQLALLGGITQVTGNTFIGQNSSIGLVEQSTLRLLDAQLISASATLGRGAFSLGRVVIDEQSVWGVNGQLLVGDSGDAEIEVQAGADTICQFTICITAPIKGVLNSGSAVLANSANADVTADIYGHWVSGNLTVGSAGDASIRLLGKRTHVGPPPPFGNDYATVGTMSSDEVVIGALAGSRGSVHLDGSEAPLFSEWDIAGSLAVGGTMSAAGGVGILDIELGNDVSVGTNFRIWPGGTLGLAKGSLLAVGGAAQLSGTLEFEITDATVPQFNDTFQLLTAGSVVGTFNSLSLPPLSANLSWSVQYNPTNVTLKVVSALAGDYNQNGKVDAADYVLWRNNPGTYGGNPAGYNTWRTNFGQPPGSGAGEIASAAVPEPTTLMLLIFAPAGLCLRRRRTT